MTRELEQALGKGGCPVVLVLGDAPLLVSRAVAVAREHGVARCGLPQFNCNSFRCSDGEGVAAVAAARTMPMMADLRLVLVHSIESGSNAFFEALLEYVSEPNPSTLLVLSGGRFPAVKKGGKNWKSRLQHAVRKVGHVVNIMMKDVDPIRFAQSHARSLGKELGRREASMLVSVVGADLAVISQELEKVSLFVGDQVEIRSEDIAEACSLLAEEGLWELTAGLAEANSDRALRALYRRLEEGVAPHQLLGQVTWQVREMLAIAELLRTGSTPADVGRQHRARPQVIAKIQEQARHRLAQPAATLEKIASANRAMNLHRAGGRRILEALLIELCA